MTIPERRRSLSTAVDAARRIRRALVARRGGWRLTGDCGLASALLAMELGDVGSLRLAWYDHWQCEAHVWNMFDGVVVDITLSQFTEKRGVYVGKPLAWHHPVSMRGRRTLADVLTWGYGKSDHHKVSAIAEWAARIGALDCKETT